MNWDDWIKQLTPAQITELTNVLNRSSTEVETARASTKDYLYAAPPYIDIFTLIPLYHKLAFKKNLLIKGPKGDGKSLSITAFASTTGTPLIVQACSDNTKSKDLIGTFFMRGDQTPFVLGSMATAIDIANEYGRAIIAFEEVNALTPQTQKQLNEFLDFRKSVSIPQIGKTYRLRPEAQLWIVAMMNPSVYGGTYELNEDFRSRWLELELGYPTKDQEIQILETNITKPNDMGAAVFKEILDQCVNIAAQTRDKKNTFNYALSSRDVVNLAESIILLGKSEALQLLSHKFEGKEHELIASRISSTFSGAPKVKDKWNSARSAV